MKTIDQLGPHLLDQSMDVAITTVHELGTDVINGLLGVLAPFEQTPLDSTRAQTFSSWTTSQVSSVELVADAPASDSTPWTPTHLQHTYHNSDFS
ncbi:MAG TPA: hypothetical protein VK674_02825 [Candidatus Limnocylindria bacterium]|nr:hypothetical protein [Candidatus Limnocylindria bacterium]